jgi:uncharacterized protein with von Willebrand factor type A (vWA) domain
MMHTDYGYVIECPPEDRRRFESVAADSRSLVGLLERGSSRLRSFPTLMSDVFCFFYLPEPTLRRDIDGAADRLNYLILKFLSESSQYSRLRSKTMLDFEAALAASERFCEMLLEYLRLGPLQGDAAAENRPPEYVKIEVVDFTDKAKAGGRPGIGTAVLVFAKQVEETVDAHRVLTDLSRTWGTEPGFLQRLPYEERAALARRVQGNHRLLELARIVGRYRALAINKHQSRVAEVPHEVFDVTLGDDWPWLLQQELMLLPHRELRYDFYFRLLDGRIAQYDLHGKENAGKGSLVVCIDTSGSMCGSREMVSKAIALALLDIARLQNRNYVAILFSSPGQWRAIAFSGNNARISEPAGASGPVSFLEGMLRVGEDFFGGGTDYETPLREAIRFMGADDAGYKDGDIVFITDDQCEVSQAFLREYAAIKLEREFSTFSVIIEERASDARTLRKFSDQVISSFELAEEVADRIFESV